MHVYLRLCASCKRQRLPSWWAEDYDEVACVMLDDDANCEFCPGKTRQLVSYVIKPH